MENYKLVQPQNKERNKFIVTVTADSNDADCITTINTYTKPFFEETIVYDLIDLLQNYSEPPHTLNEYDGEYEDLPYNPNDDYGRCHSLESIDIKYVDDNGFTWNIELNT